jgi:superfamily II DNA or RNA helicase
MGILKSTNDEKITVPQMQLRDYQQTLYNEIKNSIREGTRNPLIVSATGSGKTATFCYIAGQAHKANSPTLILVHRRELVSQTSATLKRFGIPHGIIQPGVSGDPLQRVQLGMVQTISRRVDKITPPRLIIIDECHHAVSSTYQGIIKAFPAAIQLGFTATPMRLDGKGLGTHFSKIIEGPTVEWLISNGHLVRPKYYAPPQVAVLNGIKKIAGDYSSSELAGAMDKPSITGDAVAHYNRICPKSKSVVFCCTLDHATHVCESFNQSGIPAGIIHGKLTPEARKQVVDNLTNGKIRVMASVDVVSEGFDLPTVETAILLRPTTSLGLFLQQIGRVLRPAANKTAYVLDHVGNLTRHGLAEDPREWSLEGQGKKSKKGEAALGLKQCPKCYCMHPPAPECPECGYVHEMKPSRILSVIEGNLEEFKRAPISDAVRYCKTRNDLILLQKAKGYKPGWVWFMAKELGIKGK